MPNFVILMFIKMQLEFSADDRSERTEPNGALSLHLYLHANNQNKHKAAAYKVTVRPKWEENTY